MNKKIEQLLAKVTRLYQQSEKKRAKKEERGEYFNVFNTIGLRSEEVRLHSAMIAELLNPKGSHGLSDLFLQAFLEILELPDYVKEAKGKIKERNIGPKSETEGGQIDIIIEDGNHAVIIEDKIYASDQYNQLLRYNNYGKKKFKKGFELVYLTLEGYKPDDKSLGGEKFPYHLLSYKKDIVEWLNRCTKIAKSKRKPLVEAVIIQYKELIKQITNTDMDTEYKEQLIESAIKPDNAIAMSELLAIEDEWFNRIVDIYIWEPLNEYAESNKMKMERCNDQGCGAWIYKEEWKHCGIYIWTDSSRFWSDLYISIAYYKEPNRRVRIPKKDFQKLDCLEDEPDKDNPFGSEFLPSEICNWGPSITKKIVSGEVVDYITNKFDQILKEINKKKIVLF